MPLSLIGLLILLYQDMSNIGSSTGWTDEKHMLYITSLEESFVNQLYSGNGEINSLESFHRTSGVWQHTCYSGNGRNTKYDQVLATNSHYSIIYAAVSRVFCSLCKTAILFCNKISGPRILGDDRG